MMGMLARAPLRRWGTRALLPRASHKDRRARAGGELATPGASASPEGPALTVSRHGRRQGLWGGRPRLGYPRRARLRALSAGPARSGARDAHRCSRRAPPPRRPEPRGRPRRRPSTPAKPDRPSGAPALPTPRQHPSQRQSSRQPGPLLSRYLARSIPPLHTCFLVSIPPVHPGLVLLSSRVDPEPQLNGAKQGNRWENAPRTTQVPPGLEDRDSPGAPLRFCPQGENRALHVVGSQIPIR